MSKGLIIGGVLFLMLIVIGVVVYFMMSGDDEKTTGPSGGSPGPAPGPAPPKTIKTNQILSTVSDPVTLTGVQANDPSTFNAKTKGVLIANIAIDADSEGVIFESGATGRGIVLYAFDGSIYFQAGAGNVAGGTIEVSSPINSTLSKNQKTEIGVSVDVSANPSRARLFINGVEVDNSTSGATPSLSGPDAAGSGKKYGGISVSRLSPYSVYSDTIYDVTLYPGVYI